MKLPAWRVLKHNLDYLLSFQSSETIINKKYLTSRSRDYHVANVQDNITYFIIEKLMKYRIFPFTKSEAFKISVVFFIAQLAHKKTKNHNSAFTDLRDFFVTMEICPITCASFISIWSR